MNIDIGNDSREVTIKIGISREGKPVGMIRNADKLLSILIAKAYDWTYVGPRQFLDKYDVKSRMSFEDSVDYKVVLAKFLRKDVNLFQNHTWILLTAEQIEVLLFSQSS